jgi:hypothetical protein
MTNSVLSWSPRSGEGPDYPVDLTKLIRLGSRCVKGDEPLNRGLLVVPKNKFGVPRNYSTSKASSNGETIMKSRAESYKQNALGLQRAARCTLERELKRAT